MMRRSLLLAFPLLGLFVSGCANQNNEAPLRSLAASFVAGRAFDQAHGALRRDDTKALARAGDDMRRASVALGDQRLTSAFASSVASDASYVWSLSRFKTGAEKARLMQQVDRKYRAALAFLPEESPEKLLDADTLNGIGYYLADHGKNRADFERAAALTLAAYKKWDVSPTLTGVDPRLGRASGPQDSYAWALFKLGRFEEARQQQEAVLKLLREKPGERIDSEHPFHMAEIYNALGKAGEARREYVEALKLQPDAELKEKIEKGLESLDFPRV